MGGAEGVVHVLVAVSREASGELGGVSGFARMKAQVLENDDVAGTEPRRLAVLAADHVGPKADGLAEEFLKPRRDRPQAERGIGLAVGPAQMRSDDHRGALLASRADGGEGGAEATVVGHSSVPERYVQIGAQQEPAAAQIEVSKGQLSGFQKHGGAKP